MARKRNSGSRRYPRTARLSEVIREIVASELERIDDERLGLFTVTAVEVDPGLEWARIYWSDIGASDEDVLAVLEEHRPRLQSEVNRQSRMRRTPVLSFHADEVDRHGSRIDEILADLHRSGELGDDDPDDPIAED